MTASEISPAAELIANNVDLLTEILVRLPVKPIIQFKRVSKHWLSLLSDPEFATIHFNRSPRPSSISGLYFYTREKLRHSISGLYFYGKETLHSVSLHGRYLHLPSLSFLDGVRQRSKIVVEDSSNGLLLCYVKPHDDYGNRGAPRQYLDPTCDDYYRYAVERYIVCNPITKKYTVIPDPERDQELFVWSAYLVFDPVKSPRHYRVVLVTSSSSAVAHQIIQIIVYSSQSLCWRKVALPEKDYPFGRGVFWNGAIHWLTNEGFLKRFDVDFEKMIAMKNPQKPRILLPVQNLSMYFGECGGRLILIQSPKWRSGRFKILELESDYSGWVVKCRVNRNPLIAQFPEPEEYNVLYAVEGEIGRGCTLLLATPWKIISYNLKDKTCEVLGDVPHEAGEFVLPDYALPFVETLFL